MFDYEISQVLGQRPLFDGQIHIIASVLIGYLYFFPAPNPMKQS